MVWGPKLEGVALLASPPLSACPKRPVAVEAAGYPREQPQWELQDRTARTLRDNRTTASGLPPKNGRREEKARGKKSRNEILEGAEETKASSLGLPKQAERTTH